MISFSREKLESKQEVDNRLQLTVDETPPSAEEAASQPRVLRIRPTAFTPTMDATMAESA